MGGETAVGPMVAIVNGCGRRLEGALGMSPRPVFASVRGTNARAGAPATAGERGYGDLGAAVGGSKDLRSVNRR